MAVHDAWNTQSGAGATPDARAAGSPARPDPEVVVDAKRRTFTAEYKQRVLAAADAAGNGGIGALLRREGLYSSHLVTWRHERRAGILKGLTPRTRGPKPTRSPQDEEIRQLREANQRLTEELRKAAIVIDVQRNRHAPRRTRDGMKVVGWSGWTSRE